MANREARRRAARANGTLPNRNAGAPKPGTNVRASTTVRPTGLGGPGGSVGTTIRQPLSGQGSTATNVPLFAQKQAGQQARTDLRSAAIEASTLTRGAPRIAGSKFPFQQVQRDVFNRTVREQTVLSAQIRREDREQELRDLEARNKRVETAARSAIQSRRTGFEESRLGLEQRRVEQGEERFDKEFGLRERRLEAEFGPEGSRALDREERAEREEAKAESSAEKAAIKAAEKAAPKPLSRATAISDLRRQHKAEQDDIRNQHIESENARKQSLVDLVKAHEDRRADLEKKAESERVPEEVVAENDAKLKEAKSAVKDFKEEKPPPRASFKPSKEDIQKQRQVTIEPASDATPAPEQDEATKSILEKVPDADEEDIADILQRIQEGETLEEILAGAGVS